MNKLQAAIASVFRIDTKPKRKRAYASAKTISYLSNWITSPTNPNVDIKQGLNSLRARSREAVQNNSFVRRFLTLVKSNVVGESGPLLQSRVMLPSGKPDTKSRNAIEQAWRTWGKYGSPDVTGTKTWLHMQNEFWQQVMMDGEYIAIEVPTKDNKFGYQLQVIDPMMLDVSYSDTLKNGRYIKESIEYNSTGKPLAYHFIVSDPEQDHYTVHGKHYQRIIASRVYHVFLPDFINQRRGVPAVAAALLRLNMLDGYTEAEVVAARTGASTIGVWEDNKEGEGYNGDDKDSDDEYVQGAEPGGFIKAPNGATLNMWDPSHPNTGYGQFTSDLLREISSGLNVSYASLSNNYSDANYSSLRQALITEQAVWKVLQNWMIDTFVRRIYESWFRQSYSLQAISVNGVPLRFDVDGYLEHSWQPKRWQWVDPLKEMNANKVAMDNYITSPQEVIRDKGRDPDDVLDEIEQWNRKLEEKNLPKPAQLEAGFLLDDTNEEDKKPKKD